MDELKLRQNAAQVSNLMYEYLVEHQNRFTGQDNKLRTKSRNRHADQKPDRIDTPLAIPGRGVSELIEFWVKVVNVIYLFKC